MSNSRKISIITVVYNAGKVLQKTLDSLAGQSNPAFELIIVDGNSTDNTLDIIRRNGNLVNKWISEPDNGLYDAMNKGIMMATGDFLWFLNAGDQAGNEQVIEKLMHLPEADVYYSDTLVIDENVQPIGLLSELTHNNAPDQLKWNDMKKGMVVCHQSFIVKKDIAPFFDTNYKLSADIDWVIKCLKKSKNNYKCDFNIAKFMRAGLSKQHLKAGMKERYHILKKHFGFIPNVINHVFLLGRYLYSGRKSKVK